MQLNFRTGPPETIPLYYLEWFHIDSLYPFEGEEKIVITGLLEFLGFTGAVKFLRAFFHAVEEVYLSSYVLELAEHASHGPPDTNPAFSHQREQAFRNKTKQSAEAYNNKLEQMNNEVAQALKELGESIELYRSERLDLATNQFKHGYQHAMGNFFSTFNQLKSEERQAIYWEAFYFDAECTATHDVLATANDFQERICANLHDLIDLIGKKANAIATVEPAWQELLLEPAQLGQRMLSRAAAQSPLAAPLPAAAHQAIAACKNLPDLLETLLFQPLARQLAPFHTREQARHNCGSSKC